MVKRSTLVRGAAVLVVSALPYALLRFPATRNGLLAFVAFVRGAGPVGAVALVGFDVAWSLVAAPFWVMAAVAGYVYGFPLGVLVAVPSTTVATCVALMVGRFACAHLLPPPAADAPRVAAVRKAIEADGLKIAFLLRLTPFVPQSVLTYVLASTSLRLRDFALASAGGLFPLLVFNAYVGSLVGDAAALLAGDVPDVGMAKWFALGGGLVAGATALTVIARVARRALARAIGEQGAYSSDSAATGVGTSSR
ncbi:MAG: TVP38/TMEM64 family protein [Polyangiaceae bacterium]